MTPDQLRLDETGAWMDRARRDLRAARLLIDGDALSEALYHCQQAVEKALKAFLTFNQTPFRKTHDLTELSASCAAIDASLAPDLAQSEGLTQFAWRFRYPGASYEPEASEAAEALLTAETAVRKIAVRL